MSKEKKEGQSSSRKSKEQKKLFVNKNNNEDYFFNNSSSSNDFPKLNPEVMEDSEFNSEAIEDDKATRASFDGKLFTVQKGDTTVSFTAFSGSDKFEPIPEGIYCVRKQGEAQNAGGILGSVAKVTEGNLNLFQNSNRSKWFLLEPQYSPVKPRYRLAIHAGTVSEGCVTITDSKSLAEIAEIFESSKSFTGLGSDGYPPGSVVNGKAPNNSLREVSCVAILTVKYTSSMEDAKKSADYKAANATPDPEKKLSTNTPGYDVDKATTFLDQNKKNKDEKKGACAKYVRKALEAGGIDTTGHPVSAKDYNSFLKVRASPLFPKPVISQKKVTSWSLAR